MKYPRIDPRKDRRRKIMPWQHGAICRQYKLVRNKSAIAIRYGVSIPTIAKIVDPDYRARSNAIRNEARRLRWKSDPLFRKDHRIRALESKRYVKSVNPKMLTYDTAQHRQWIASHPQRARELQQKYVARKRVIERRREVGDTIAV